VTELKQEDVFEIYSLREALEKLALRYTIRDATEEQIEELGKIVEEMENLAKSDYNQLEATDLDMEFHYTLCKISGHKRGLNAWIALSSQIRLVLLKHRLGNPKDHRIRSVTWHSRIVASLRERDLDKAEKELHTHMAASLEWLGNQADY